MRVKVIAPDQASKGQANRFSPICLRRTVLPGHLYNRRSPARRPARLIGHRTLRTTMIRRSGAVWSPAVWNSGDMSSAADVLRTSVYGNVPMDDWIAESAGSAGEPWKEFVSARDLAR